MTGCYIVEKKSECVFIGKRKRRLRLCSWDIAGDLKTISPRMATKFDPKLIKGINQSNSNPNLINNTICQNWLSGFLSKCFLTFNWWWMKTDHHFLYIIKSCSTFLPFIHFIQNLNLSDVQLGIDSRNDFLIWNVFLIMKLRIVFFVFFFFFFLSSSTTQNCLHCPWIEHHFEQDHSKYKWWPFCAKSDLIRLQSGKLVRILKSFKLILSLLAPNSPN